MSGGISKAPWPFKVATPDEKSELGVERQIGSASSPLTGVECWERGWTDRIDRAMAQEARDALLRAAAYLAADNSDAANTIDAAEADRIAGVLRRLAQAYGPTAAGEVPHG
jgi:hypothetical protein